MAPDAKKLEQALADTVASLWGTNENNLPSINLIRKRVEEKLGLKQDFFKGAAWSERSKSVIKAKVPKTKAKARAAASNIAKRKSPGQEAPAKKRQKKAKVEPEDLSELSDAPSGEDKLAPEKKRANSKKAAASGNKGKAKKNAKGEASESDLDLESELSSPPSGSAEKSDFEEESNESAKPAKKGRKAAKKGAEKAGGAPSDVEEDDTTTDTTDTPDKELTDAARQAVGPDGDSPLSDVPESEEPGDSRPEKPEAKEADATKHTATVEDSSDLSDVIDEPPPPRRKAKAKDVSEKGAVKASVVKKKKAVDGAAADLSPGEAEIKKLQGHLVKCGVRKIWGIELRKYGDDARAKIRHLQGLLRDIGLEGRFSEAKAENIRMRRELMADVEGLTEMNKNWKESTGQSARARGRTIRSMKAPSSSDEEAADEDGGSKKAQKGQPGGDGDENSAEDSNVEVKPTAARGGLRRRADLAFLDDDDEDESD